LGALTSRYRLRLPRRRPARLRPLRLRLLHRSLLLRPLLTNKNFAILLRVQNAGRRGEIAPRPAFCLQLACVCGPAGTDFSATTTTKGCPVTARGCGTGLGAQAEAYATGSLCGLSVREPTLARSGQAGLSQCGLHVRRRTAPPQCDFAQRREIRSGTWRRFGFGGLLWCRRSGRLAKWST
jgi:hypothetical protein